MWGVILMYMSTGRLHFSSRKTEGISLKFRFVRYDLYSRKLQYSTSQHSFGKLFETFNL